MSQQAVLVRGSGDVGAAVAIVLHRAGFGVAIDEVAAPAAARRGMAFADAVFVGVGSSQLGVGTRSPGSASCVRRRRAGPWRRLMRKYSESCVSTPTSAGFYDRRALLHEGHVA
jgi:2-polyprenyl-6-methoxyphenol hydroxylase-like FAD-dependent oxidoreductase